jgi:hypothetical protein
MVDEAGSTAQDGVSSSLIERTRSNVLFARVRRRPAALVEMVGLLLGFLLFTRLHAAAGKDVATATANALALQSLERALHIDIDGRPRSAGLLGAAHVAPAVCPAGDRGHRR